VRDILGRAGLWEILLRDDAVHAGLREALAAIHLPPDSPLRQQEAERQGERVF
jgi:hypothetical protein